MDDTNRMAITVCGDGGCGKSSITLRLVRSQWTHEYDPTIEDSYSVTRTIDGTTYSLSLTDTAGQEEYRGLWSVNSLNADAFLLVYDITSAASLQQLEYFDSLIDMEREVREDRGRPPPVCIVAGNKVDLQSLREVGARDGLDWARRRGYGFMETSAREMVNIEETFALLVRRVVEARRVTAMSGDARTGGRAANRALPSSTAMTRPIDELDEKEAAAAAQARENARWSSDRRRRRRWWHSLCCM